MIVRTWDHKLKQTCVIQSLKYAYLYTHFSKYNAQVKLLVFYNVQTTNLTFVGKICDIQHMNIALCNSK